jgi:hypothetical protein
MERLRPLCSGIERAYCCWSSCHKSPLWLSRVEPSTLLLDLVPSDYFLFRLLKTLLWGKMFSSDEEVVDAVYA